MSLSFNKNESSLTVFLNGVMYTVASDAPNYKKAWEAVKSKDEVAIEAALNVATQVHQAFANVVGTTEGLVVSGSGVTFRGKPLHNVLSDRIMEFISEGVDVTHLVKFLQNFLQNPMVQLVQNPDVLSLMGLSADAASQQVNQFVDDFYAFLNHRNLPITDDGCFLAYKTVDGGYWSKRGGTAKLVQGRVDSSGRIYNAPGEVIEVTRDSVDPNRHAECSYGLHVGCLEYSGPGGSYNNSGDKVVVVKVNPADVVAVPPDYNRTKMRTVQYEVIQDYISPLNRPVYTTGQQLVEEAVEEYRGEEIDIDNINEQDEISFEYTKNDGVTKVRYLDVLEVKYDRYGNVESFFGLLMAPEESEGEKRSFKAEHMSDIRLLN